MSEDRAVFEAALLAQREGRPAALATVIQVQGSVPRQPGSKMLVWADGRIVGTVGGGEVEAQTIREAQSAIHDGKTRVLSYNLSDPASQGSASGDPAECSGTVSVFVEPLLLPPTLVVFGCGHVGKAVAELAKWLDLRVIVADDRPGLATPEQIPGMDGYLETPPAELTQRLEITSRTCIAALTRGVDVDKVLLPVLLGTPTPYIGVIGGRRRWTLTMQVLAEQGISPADLARIHSPIGLDLKAETPKEIAVSILAEIIMVLRGGTGKSMHAV